MKLPKLKGRSPLILVNALLFTVAFASMCYYQMSGLKLHFHHESAFPLLYAKANLETHLPYSPRFSAREISPLSWPLVGTFLLLFKPVSLSAHAMTSVLFSLFMAVTGYIYCRVAGFLWQTTLLFLTLLFISFPSLPPRYEWLDQVFIWPMNSYGLYDTFSLVSAILLYTCMVRYAVAGDPPGTAPERRFKLPMPAFIGCACVWFFCTGLNSTRGALTISGPVFAGLALCFLQQEHVSFKRLRAVGIFAALACSMVLGVALILLLTKDVPQPWQQWHKFFTVGSPAELKDRLVAFPVAWLRLFSAIPKRGDPVFSAEACVRIATTIFAFFVLCLPIVRSGSLARNGSLLERLMVYRFFFVLLVVGTSFLYGTASTEIRYLIPVAYAAFFVLPFSIDRWFRERKFASLVLLYGLMVPMLAYSAVFLTKYRMDEYKETPLYKFAAFLQSNGLTFGFAGPWNTQAITVWHFSDEAVRVGLIDPEGMSPHGHGDRAWYSPAYHKGKTFLALPANVRAATPKALAMAEKSLGTLTYEDWVVDVYPDNIAAYLDCRGDEGISRQPDSGKYLTGAVDVAIAGRGYQVGCEGWGGVEKVNGLIVRPVAGGSASVYLRAAARTSSITVDSLARGSQGAPANASLRVLVNNVEAGTIQYSQAGVLQHQVFALRAELEDSREIEVRLVPQGPSNSIAVKSVALGHR